MRLLVPYAQAPDTAWLDALQALQLPHLKWLLANARSVRRDEQSPMAWSTASEAAKAQLLGWPARDGAYPWAAYERPAQLGAAWVHLCHWQMGQSSAQLTDPDALQISVEESQALMARMAPYFQEDGVQLECSSLQPDRWWASGEVFKGVRCGSPARLLGQDLGGDWLQDVAHALPAKLRRLQSEMQMLLYQDPVNEVREQTGRLPLNALWFSGCGALDEVFLAPDPSGGDFHCNMALEKATMQGHLNEWLAQWTVLDATVLQDLVKHVQDGVTCHWVLTGRDSWQTLVLAPGTGWRMTSRLPLWARPGLATQQRHWLLQSHAA